MVVISISDDKLEEKRSLKQKLNVLKKIVPKIMKFASRAVMVVATQPNEAVSYITWKLSKLPPNRVLGTGTLLDSVRFQYYLGQRLGLASASIDCMSIGAQGDLSGIGFPNEFFVVTCHFALLPRMIMKFHCFTNMIYCTEERFF